MVYSEILLNLISNPFSKSYCKVSRNWACLKSGILRGSPWLLIHLHSILILQWQCYPSCCCQGKVTDSRSFVCRCLMSGSVLTTSKKLTMAWIKQKLSRTYHCLDRKACCLSMPVWAQALHLAGYLCQSSVVSASLITSLYFNRMFISTSPVNHIKVKDDWKCLKPGVQ